MVLVFTHARQRFRSRCHYHVNLRSEASSEAIPVDPSDVSQVRGQLMIKTTTTWRSVAVNHCVPEVCVTCDTECQVRPAQSSELLSEDMSWDLCNAAK